MERTEVRIWSRRVPIVSAAGRTALLALVCAALFSFPLAAQERWKIQFFYDQQDSSLELRDIQCPSAERCTAAGVIIQKDGREKGAAVSTRDGGLHWSMAEIKENPLSLFFLNDSLGWMVTERGIWISETGEPTWKKLEGLKGIVRVHFLDPSHGFAIGSPGAIHETADGGRKWTMLPAGNVPTADPKHTFYEYVAFRGQHGLVSGEVSPEGAEALPNFNSSAANPRRKPTVVVVETLDRGKTWTSRTPPLSGVISQMSFTRENLPVFLLESLSSSSTSRVIQGSPGSRDLKPIFSERNRAVTSFALFPEGGAVLAAIEPPGNSGQILIPGKLKMLASDDLKTWREMPVDYRAVAQRAVIAAFDARHQWVVTDTGMILGLTTVGSAGHFSEKQKTTSARAVLSTSSPQ